jgi:hypothetical protein
MLPDAVCAALSTARRSRHPAAQCPNSRERALNAQQRAGAAVEGEPRDGSGRRSAWLGRASNQQQAGTSSPGRAHRRRRLPSLPARCRDPSHVGPPARATPLRRSSRHALPGSSWGPRPQRGSRCRLTSPAVGPDRRYPPPPTGARPSRAGGRGRLADGGSPAQLPRGPCGRTPDPRQAAAGQGTTAERPVGPAPWSPPTDGGPRGSATEAGSARGTHGGAPVRQARHAAFHVER